MVTGSCVSNAAQSASPQVLRMKGEVIMPPENKHEVGFYFFDGDQWRRVGEAPVIKDPKDELKEAAVQLHDLYNSFIEAGFSRMEALVMVSEIIKGAKQ